MFPAFMGKSCHSRKEISNFQYILDRFILLRINDDSETSAFDDCSNSLLRLNNSTIVFMKEVSYALALICIWREENFGKSGKVYFKT